VDIGSITLKVRGFILAKMALGLLEGGGKGVEWALVMDIAAGLLGALPGDDLIPVGGAAENRQPPKRSESE
jgi:hypothetical protein